jgi:two-component system response regulator QseB
LFLFFKKEILLFLVDLARAMKVLIVEDNRALLDMISAHLGERGFTVDAVRTGGEALERVAGATYDAVVLDLGLPDMDGMDVLRELRERAMTPTLILTARDGVAHRIAGLDGGADDYILKPFDLAEFEARLRAVLRRPGLRAPPCPSFGDISFDIACHAARVGDRSIELTPREATLFEALIKNGERILVRDVLADRLFDLAEDVSANALDAIVSRLRRKLAVLESSVSIETMRGIGYRLRGGQSGA